MKKSILLFLSFLLVSSCSNKYDVKPSKTVEISVYCESKSEKEIINSIISDWNDNYSKAKQFNIIYTDNFIDSSLAYESNIEYNKLLNEYALVLDDNISEKISGSILDNSMKEYTKDSLLYGYPVNIESSYQMLYYNSEYISNEEAKSLETILEIAKKHNKKVVYDITSPLSLPNIFMSKDACGYDSLSYSINSSYKEEYQVNWDNEDGVKVVEYISSLLSSYFNDGTLLSLGGPTIKDYLDMGAIVFITGEYVENDLKNAFKENIEVSILPNYHINDKAYQMTPLVHTTSYLINKNKSKNEIETAALLAEVLTSKEAQLKRYEFDGRIPTNTYALNDSRFVDNASKYDLAKLEQFNYSVNVSKIVGNDYFTKFSDISKTIVTGLKDDTWDNYLKNKIKEIEE